MKTPLICGLEFSFGLIANLCPTGLHRPTPFLARQVLPAPHFARPQGVQGAIIHVWLQKGGLPKLCVCDEEGGKLHISAF